MAANRSVARPRIGCRVPTGGAHIERARWPPERTGYGSAVFAAVEHGREFPVEAVRFSGEKEKIEAEKPRHTPWAHTEGAHGRPHLGDSVGARPQRLL